MVERQVSKDKYILAGIFTVLLFSLGLLLGMLIDTERLRWLEYSSKEQEINLKSLQFQYLYLTSFEDEKSSCAVLQSTLKRTLIDLSKSLERFEQFKEDSNINSEEYELVGRRYLLDNFNYWLFARKAKKACGLDVVSILYFYHPECEICPDQGVILTYFKNLFGEKLLVFPIDTSLLPNEPVIEVFMNRFNITTYPTLIVEDRKFEYVVEKDQLKTVICSKFKNESAC